MNTFSISRDREFEGTSQNIMAPLVLPTLPSPYNGYTYHADLLGYIKMDGFIG